MDFGSAAKESARTYKFVAAGMNFGRYGVSLAGDYTGLSTDDQMAVISEYIDSAVNVVSYTL